MLDEIAKCLQSDARHLPDPLQTSHRCSASSGLPLCVAAIYDVAMFQCLHWLPDRMELNGFTYRLEHYRSDDWQGGDHFSFYKIKPLVDLYDDFFSRQRVPALKNVFELGIYDGGSTAFWCEVLNPEKLVAIDIQDREDSGYFRQWAALGKREDCVRTYWRTDQSDRHRLRKIVSDNFRAPLDLVIDDASHLYSPSRASFEALFPLCRPGAIYVLEDWAWDHWEGFSGPSHPWARERRLTDFVTELIEATGTSTSLISRVEIYQGFAAIFRGSGEINGSHDFSLDNWIRRRPTRPGLLRNQAAAVANFLRRAWHRLRF
jgi:predicted O-methyltransferase YrrM